MDYRVCKGDRVSLLGLGCMRLPTVGAGKQDVDYAEAQKIFDLAVEGGVNYFDTAYVYHGGDSEKFVGEALKKHDRKKLFIATKMPVWMAQNTADYGRIFEEQLARLQTDYIDYYLFHSLNHGAFDKAVERKLYDFLVERKKRGQVRHIGFSFHDEPGAFPAIVNRYDWDFAQLQINYIDWSMQDAASTYGLLEKKGIPCIVMEPVRGGSLADPCPAANELFRAARPDKSIASWAIRYAASLPGVLTVLSGMSNLEQMRDNLSSMTPFEPLTASDSEVIERAAAAYKETVTVPCTGCRYCMDCPFGVDIPAIFAMNNRFAVTRDWNGFKEEYLGLAPSARIDSCTACGLCATHCPQQIAIPERLAEIGKITADMKA